MFLVEHQIIPSITKEIRSQYQMESNWIYTVSVLLSIFGMRRVVLLHWWSIMILTGEKPLPSQLPKGTEQWISIVKMRVIVGENLSAIYQPAVIRQTLIFQARSYIMEMVTPSMERSPWSTHSLALFWPDSLIRASITGSSK